MHKSIFPMFILALLLCFSSISFADTWALLVGINDYQDSRISDLNYTVDDVTRFRDVMKSCACALSNTNVCILEVNFMALNGFKVVKELNSHYFSSSVPANCEGYTEYKLNEFVKRQDKCGPLTVWESHEAAERHLKREQNGSLVIFSCEYEPSEDRYLYVSDLPKIDSAKFRDMDFADRIRLLSKLNCK
jgi:hypothetical protein